MHCTYKLYNSFSLGPCEYSNSIRIRYHADIQIWFESSFCLFDTSNARLDSNTDIPFILGVWSTKTRHPWGCVRAIFLFLNVDSECSRKAAPHSVSLGIRCKVSFCLCEAAFPKCASDCGRNSFTTECLSEFEFDSILIDMN